MREARHSPEHEHLPGLERCRGSLRGHHRHHLGDVVRTGHFRLRTSSAARIHRRLRRRRLLGLQSGCNTDQGQTACACEQWREENSCVHDDVHGNCCRGVSITQLTMEMPADASSRCAVHCRNCTRRRQTAKNRRIEESKRRNEGTTALAGRRPPAAVRAGQCSGKTSTTRVHKVFVFPEHCPAQLREAQSGQRCHNFISLILDMPMSTALFRSSSSSLLLRIFGSSILRREPSARAARHRRSTPGCYSCHRPPGCRRCVRSP